MKIRQGFVSNSSSSSFMVGLPKGLKEKEKKALLLGKMGIDESSFFFSAAKNIIECILSSECIRTREKLVKELYASSWESVLEDYREGKLFNKCKEKGLDFYMGSATNECYKIGEQLFCEMEWFVDDKDFFMNKEAGF